MQLPASGVSLSLSCGFGDLLPNAGDPDELVVATLDGDLFVYELSAGGVGNVLFRNCFEGSVGAHNSLIIEDLDLVNGNELYVAGSMGGSGRTSSRCPSRPRSSCTDRQRSDGAAPDGPLSSVSATLLRISRITS